jgi:hypothetical protein
MIYAQLYHRSTGYNKAKNDFSGPVTAIPMVGSDSVVMLDGRSGTPRLHRKTKEAIQKHMRKDSIVGYQLIKAQRFTDDGHKLSGIVQLVDPPLPLGDD